MDVITTLCINLYRTKHSQNEVHPKARSFEFLLHQTRRNQQFSTLPNSAACMAAKMANEDCTRMRWKRFFFRDIEWTQHLQKVADLFLFFFFTCGVFLVSNKGKSTNNGSGGNNSKGLGGFHLDNFNNSASVSSEILEWRRRNQLIDIDMGLDWRVERENWWGYCVESEAIVADNLYINIPFLTLS